MKKSNVLFIANILIIVLTILNLFFINEVAKKRIIEYSTMLASKITKYVVNNAYSSEEFDMNNEKIYEIVQNNDGEIKTIIYDAMSVNNLLNSITEKVYSLFNSLEIGDIGKLSIRENILINARNDTYQDGIVLEVPIGIVTNNFLFANMGPKIPVKISLTGEFESHISTKVEEYGINNALISVFVDIRVTEQITMPFITEKIIIDNQIPIALNLVNGKIPNYYLNGFDKNSNLYQVN